MKLACMLSLGQGGILLYFHLWFFSSVLDRKHHFSDQVGGIFLITSQKVAVVSFFGRPFLSFSLFSAVFVISSSSLLAAAA